MKSKFSFYSIVIVVLIITIAFCLVFKLPNLNKTEDIVINGIENFHPERSDEVTYLLYYPSDVRVSQNETYVMEVNLKGEMIKRYKIIDDDFRRMKIHQKPNDLNKLYISLFGETKIDNYFYTYNILDNEIKKITLNYFDYEVGVDHIMHYGEDILFQTIASHKTGTQNIKEDTMEFNVSISNYSQEKSFETEYGSPTSWTALLGFNNRILYGTAGKYDENDKLITSGMGIIDLENQTVRYICLQALNN